MLKKTFGLLLLATCLTLTGCATVPMASEEENRIAQQFNPPPKGKSGLYIFRDGYFGAALKKDVFIDDIKIGETASNVFFYKQVKAGNHKISTESEFGNNDLNITTESGKNYFIRQYIKFGLFVGGADLEQISEELGKKTISELKLAQ